MTHPLDVTIDRKLARRQSPDHEQPRPETRIAPANAQLFRNLDEPGGRAFSGKTLCLIDLTEHGVGGLRYDGGGETGDQTGAEIDGGVHACGGGALVDEVGVDLFGGLFVHDEFGHCVGDPNKNVNKLAGVSSKVWMWSAPTA